jgi:uncharacterized membrane protein
MTSFQSSIFTAWLLSALLFVQGGESSFLGCSSNSNTVSMSGTSSHKVWGSTTTLASLRPPSQHQQPPSLLLSEPPLHHDDALIVPQHPHPTPTSIDPEENEPTNTINSKGQIQVSTEIELPFPKTVAFDAFSDLSRQATFSPWLTSVKYLNGATQNSVGTITRWTLSYLGLRFSWNAVSTKQDRENGIIEWESVTGLRNNGRVEFHSLGERTQMKMTMTFTTPRLAARMLGESNSIARLVENRILKSTLHNFRQVVMENDWKQKQQESIPHTSAAFTIEGSTSTTLF